MNKLSYRRPLDVHHWGRCIAALLICLLCGHSGIAQDVSGAVTPPPLSGFNGDIDIYSDYIARGLTYTREKIALQGRFEYANRRGPYVGLAFNHNTVVADKESIELDPYIGFLRHVDDWTFDIGAFEWIYPNSRLARSRNTYNTAEVYAGVAYQSLGLKVWYELSNYFGLSDVSASANYALPAQGSTRGSHYAEANFSQPLHFGLLISLHVGHQTIRHYQQLNYTDWRVGLEKSLGRGLFAGAARSDTNAQAASYTDSHGLNLARGKWVAYLRWAFP